MGVQLINIEFQEVEKHPVLYNYSLPSYSDNNSIPLEAVTPTPLTRPLLILDLPSSSSSVQVGEKETEVSFGQQKRRTNAKQKAEF